MSKCLVVPRTSLETMPFWSTLPKVDGHICGGMVLPPAEMRQLLETVWQERQFLERNGEDGVETRPEYQQVIFYGLVIQDNKFFVYERGTKEYGEQRLASKLSAGVGGHIEPHDTDLQGSLIRELDEELLLTKEGTPVPVPAHIKVVGIIKDERDKVGGVHVGIVCLVRVDPGVNVQIKSEENVKGWMTTPEEYNDLVSSGNYTPEGWTTVLIDNFVPLALA